MTKTIIYMTLVAIAVATILSLLPMGNEDGLFVMRVIDGDTIELSNGERVRLIGINTPERGSCGAEEAKHYMIYLVKAAEIMVQADVQSHDRYGRHLYYVWAKKPGGNWVFVNVEMVASGWAKTMHILPNTEHRRYLDATETIAKLDKKGLWGRCN